MATKKDFKLVASAMRETQKWIFDNYPNTVHQGDEILRILANELSYRFRADNPNFDNVLFYHECGLG